MTRLSSILIFTAIGMLAPAAALDAAEQTVAVPSSSTGISRTARLTLPDTDSISHCVLLLPVAGPTGVDNLLAVKRIIIVALPSSLSAAVSVALK